MSLCPTCSARSLLTTQPGTGYNAGLLSHRRGDTNVFYIDIEPDLVELARQRLARLGYHPTLIAADGAAALPDHAPFDRIIATCAVPAVPWPWATQTHTGGVILTELKPTLGAGTPGPGCWSPSTAPPSWTHAPRRIRRSCGFWPASTSVPTSLPSHRSGEVLRETSS
jgi:SAM-dependent methyltransferase